MGSLARMILGAALICAVAFAGACDRKHSKNSESDTMSAEERRAIPGAIAFISERGATRDIWLVEPSGAERRLTSGDEDEFPAAVVPGGDAIAVIATREIDGAHKEQLRLVPLAEGAEPVALNAPRARARNPSFAPDGAWLVAESDERGFSNIVRMNRSAPGEATFLTSSREGDFEPRVSPDGERIAFVSSRDGDPEIYVMDADKGEASARRVTTSGSQDWSPSWSPDGAWLAFLSDREGRDRVFLVRPDGTGTRALSGAADTGREREYAWSPDGASIAFVGRRDDGQTRIWIGSTAADGDRARALTDGRARDDQPAFSPDGKYLVHVSEPPGGNADLYLIRVDGSGKTRLTSAPGADWLPRWIAPW